MKLMWNVDDSLYWGVKDEVDVKVGISAGLDVCRSVDDEICIVVGGILGSDIFGEVDRDVSSGIYIDIG